jgi:hypothetical protein
VEEVSLFSFSFVLLRLIIIQLFIAGFIAFIVSIFIVMVSISDLVLARCFLFLQIKLNNTLKINYIFI